MLIVLLEDIMMDQVILLCVLCVMLVNIKTKGDNNLVNCVQLDITKSEEVKKSVIHAEPELIPILKVLQHANFVQPD